MVLNFVEFLTWQQKRPNQLDVSESVAEIDNRTFEDFADQLADELARSVGTNVPLLSDYAVSRAGIYEELEAEIGDRNFKICPRVAR